MNFKVNSNGKDITCDVICTFKDENNKNNYIVYTDGTKGDDGELEIYASRYIKEGNDIVLKDIENDYEWDLIDNMLKLYENGSE